MIYYTKPRGPFANSFPPIILRSLLRVFWATCVSLTQFQPHSTSFYFINVKTINFQLMCEPVSYVFYVGQFPVGLFAIQSDQEPKINLRRKRSQRT